MIHRASRTEVPGWSPESDKYGPLWVETVPLLGTHQVDRLTCVEGHVQVHWNDSGARAFARESATAARDGLAFALYMDQKLVSAPQVRSAIRGPVTTLVECGRTQANPVP